MPYNSERQTNTGSKNVNHKYSKSNLEVKTKAHAIENTIYIKDISKFSSLIACSKCIMVTINYSQYVYITI